MKKLGDKFDEFILELVNSGSCIETVLNLISMLNDAVTCRIIRALEKKVSKTINLAAPVPYCWINMGSDARHEQILRTDQDNALIFARPEPGMDTRTRLFFEVLAAEVNKLLGG